MAKNGPYEKLIFFYDKFEKITNRIFLLLEAQGNYNVISLHYKNIDDFILSAHLLLDGLTDLHENGHTLSPTIVDDPKTFGLEKC